MITYNQGPSSSSSQQLLSSSSASIVVEEGGSDQHQSSASNQHQQHCWMSGEGELVTVLDHHHHHHLNHLNQQPSLAYLSYPSVGGGPAALNHHHTPYLINYHHHHHQAPPPPPQVMSAAAIVVSSADFTHPPPSSQGGSAGAGSARPPLAGAPMPYGGGSAAGGPIPVQGGPYAAESYVVGVGADGYLDPTTAAAAFGAPPPPVPGVAGPYGPYAAQPAPYPYLGHMIFATGHVNSNNQQQQQPNSVYGGARSSSSAASSIKAMNNVAPNNIQTTATTNGRNSVSDTGSSGFAAMKPASGISDDAGSSCSGNGLASGGGQSSSRRYSDPRPSTSRQETSADSVSKTSTVKSSGVDSVDSADSGLTADHSSPEHRTSTPTANNWNHHQHQHHSNHYGAPPRPHTLPYLGGSPTAVAVADGQQGGGGAGQQQATTNAGGGATQGQGQGGGADGSRGSTPPPAPGSGDGGGSGGGAGGGGGGGGGPGGSGPALALGFPPVGPHAVYVHVNMGETLSVRVGNEIQHIPGPATVRMVSSHNAGPPVPLPLHVPPGHVVQQIVDENGTLRHLILSPQTPQPPPTAPPNAGAQFPLNGPLASNIQYVPVNGVRGAPPLPTSSSTSLASVLPNGPMAPAGAECPPPYHPLHPPPPLHHQGPGGGAPMVAVAPMPAGVAAPVVVGPHHPVGGGQQRQPLHLHTNPPHICQLHINGGNGDDGHIYSNSDRGFGKSRQGKMNSNQAGGGRGGYHHHHHHTEYQEGGETINNSPLHDTTMDDDTSAATSNGNEDEEISKIAEMLSRIPPPQVCDIGPRDALVQWQPFDCSEASASGGPFPQIDASEFTYEVLVYERRPEGKPTNNYRCQADQLQQQWLTNLKPSTEYYVRLRALLEERGLHGEPSSAVAFKTKPTHPDKMQPPRVQQRSKSWLLLRWQQPCDNGAKILGFHLEVDESGQGAAEANNNSDGGGESGFKEVFCGQLKQFKLQRLQASTLYRIRLAASNQHGKGEWSDILLVQTTGAPPLPPDPPTLSQASSYSLCLQWKRREGDEEFQLLMEDPLTGHGYLPVATTRDVTYTVGNLARYKEYRFRLTASNEDGRSTPSEFVAVRTLPARPQAPPKPHAKGRVASNNVKIAWDAPKDTGGGEIARYVLDMCNETTAAGTSSTIAAAQWTCIYDGQEREYHVSGLEPGCAYRFRLACFSPGGRSGYSEELILSTSPVAPGPCRPVQLHGKPKPLSLHLKWSPPDVHGGAEISEYELVLDETPAGAITPTDGGPSSTLRPVYQGPRTDFAVSAGLQPGRPYVFRVRAYNRAGAGPWSDRTECTTAPAPPDCAQRLRAVGQAEADRISLTWDPPVCLNGAPIVEYRLHQACRIASRSEVPSALSMGVGSIAAGNIGDSRQSTEQQQPEPAHVSTSSADRRTSSNNHTPSSSVPSSPAKSAKSGSNSASAPIRQHSTASVASSSGGTAASCGGGDVTPGVVESEYGPMSQIYAGVANNYEARGLKAASDYVFRIQAVNIAGSSRLSDPFYCRTSAGVPEPPYNLRTEVLSLSEIFVQWDSPIDNGSPVMGYYLDIQGPIDSSSSSNSNFTSPVQISANVNQYTLENLLPETTYRLRVQAYNEIGTGTFSTVVKAITFSPPPPPPVLDLSMASHNSLKLRWNEPIGANSTSSEDNALVYTVEMENKSGGFSPVAAELSARTCKVPRLNESCTYRFRVRACSTTGGAGQWSEVYAFRTLRTPPPALKSAPRVTDVTETSCQIDWQPVKVTGAGSFALSIGEKLHYALQIQGPSAASNEDFRTVYKGPSTSYHMNGLSHGSSYRVRVCVIRISPADSESAANKETETPGAPSAACTFSTVSSAVKRKSTEPSSTSDNTESELTSEQAGGVGGLGSLIRHPRQLSDRQWALIILFVFGLFAVFVAFTLQRFIPSTDQQQQPTGP